MNDFEVLSRINDMIELGCEQEARSSLIEHLHGRSQSEEAYTPLLNHLLRRVGLYPYLQLDTAMWQDRIVADVFRADVGLPEFATLHRDQSSLLSKLLKGQSVAVSAPTSFGKSFVIDAFISITRPKSVLIIVPTLALMDEVRRRLHRKFGGSYSVVTTTEGNIPEGAKIFVFPQERAITYANRIESLDLFIVDEFYKASAAFDKDRSPTLVRAMIKFSSIAKQRYFLAPNISSLKENPFTRGMEFVKTDFNTVVLKTYDLSDSTSGDVDKKSAAVRRICQPGSKTLLYAGSHSQVKVASDAVKISWPLSSSYLLRDIGRWLGDNYSATWALSTLIQHRIGLHNGQIHRAIAQMQLRLFEMEQHGLDLIVSTSSIIEGVNTSAQRVVVWSNKNGNPRLSNFDYRNLIGRGGRMFRYFVGEVYLLEKAPADSETQLTLELPESLLGVAEIDSVSDSLSEAQRDKAEAFDRDVSAILNVTSVAALQREGKLQSSDANVIWKLVNSISNDPSNWRALANLNSSNRESWEWVLFNAINLSPAGWDAPYTKVVAFIKVVADSWTSTIPAMLRKLSNHGVTVEEFFKLERTVSYKMAALLGDINTIHARVSPNRGFDVSPFVYRLSHAFLPAAVYQLEEYGLPRMLSRRIHLSAIVDFEKADLSLPDALEVLETRRSEVYELFGSPAEHFMLDHFYAGVTVDQDTRQST
jgi:hypothetical protein